MKLTAEQKIEKSHVSILQSKRFRFFSGLTMVGKVTVDDDIPTARTNGRDIAYGREFVGVLNDKQLLFVVLHELSHIAWRHTSVWRHLYEKDPILANAACDYVINLQLVDQDPNAEEIEMPSHPDGSRMGLLDERFRGMDSKQVFDILRKEFYEDGQPDGDGDGDGRGTGQGRGGRNCISRDQFDDHDWDGAGSLTDKEKQDLEGRIIRALHQGNQLIGKMGGNMPRELVELTQPEVSWKEVLRDMVKNICRGSGDSSWRRFSRRYLGAGIYLPQNIDNRLGCVVDCLDTSGSIGGVILGKFMSEVKSICEEVMPEGLHHIYWDTEVAGHEIYSPAEYDQIDKLTDVRGGGGTDPSCIPPYIRKNILDKGTQVDVVIVLTDGYFHGEGDWASLGVPVIWCVVDNRSFTATHGKTIYINSGEES